MGFDVGGKKGGVRSDINITPLVDVVLVLLIIFMVAVPMLLKQTDVKVPQNQDVEITPPPVTNEQVVLQMDKEGHISVNHEPVSLDALSARMRTIFQNRRESDRIMFFDVADEVPYGDVVRVMDMCRGAGAKILGLMTKPS